MGRWRIRGEPPHVWFRFGEAKRNRGGGGPTEVPSEARDGGADSTWAHVSVVLVRGSPHQTVQVEGRGGGILQQVRRLFDESVNL